MKLVHTDLKPIPGIDEAFINALGTELIQYGKKQKISSYVPRKNSRFYYAYLNQRVYHIARLVALAFHPNPMNYPYAIHIDGNTQNNHFQNIKWGTGSMIAQIRINNGNFNHLRELSDEQVVEIVNRLTEGEFVQPLAEEYNTSHATITRIRKRFMKEKHGNKRYHTEVKIHVYWLFRAGLTPIQISNILEISYETLWKWKNLSKEQLASSPCGHLKLSDITLN